MGTNSAKGEKKRRRGASQSDSQSAASRSTQPRVAGSGRTAQNACECVMREAERLVRERLALSAAIT